MKYLILILLLFAAYDGKSQIATYSDSESCPFVIDNIQEVKIHEKGYSHPKISPDGTKLLLTKNYKGIYLLDLKSPNKLQTISNGKRDGFHMKWSSKKGKLSYLKSTRQSDGSIKREYFEKDPMLKSIAVHNITNINSPISSLKNTNGDVTIINDIKNRKLVANDGEKVWDVTPKIGICLDIVLSPDKTKVIFTANGREYIYAVDGSGLIRVIDAGLNKSWSPDGKYILYCREDDKGGHSIVESDLYMCKSDGTQFWKLTNTPDILESRPHWSSNGNKIAYYDEPTGKIYVANIHMKNIKE